MSVVVGDVPSSQFPASASLTSEVNPRIFARLVPKRRLPSNLILYVFFFFAPSSYACARTLPLQQPCCHTRPATSCLLLCLYHTGPFGSSRRQPTVIDVLARTQQASGYLLVWLYGYLRLLQPNFWSNITAASARILLDDSFRERNTVQLAPAK